MLKEISRGIKKIPNKSNKIFNKENLILWRDNSFSHNVLKLNYDQTNSPTNGNLSNNDTNTNINSNINNTNSNNNQENYNLKEKFLPKKYLIPNNYKNNKKVSQDLFDNYNNNIINLYYSNNNNNNNCNNNNNYFRTKSFTKKQKQPKIISSTDTQKKSKKYNNFISNQYNTISINPYQKSSNLPSNKKQKLNNTFIKQTKPKIPSYKSAKNIFNTHNKTTSTLDKNFLPYAIEKIDSVEDIYNIESYLSEKEREYKINLLQQKNLQEKIGSQLNDNVNILQTNINEKLSELAISKNNFYNENKNLIKILYDNKRIKIQNKNNEEHKNEIKNDINDIIHKINLIRKENEIFNKQEEEIKDEIFFIKNKIKDLPKIINSLEEENKNILKARLILDGKIQDIKGKIYMFEYNKNNIKRNLQQTTNIYKLNHIIG